MFGGEKCSRCINSLVFFFQCSKLMSFFFTVSFLGSLEFSQLL